MRTTHRLLAVVVLKCAETAVHTLLTVFGWPPEYRPDHQGGSLQECHWLTCARNHPFALHGFRHKRAFVESADLVSTMTRVKLPCDHLL